MTTRQPDSTANGRTETTSRRDAPENEVADIDWVPDGHEFALCLTHDVDRPFKTYQSVFYALTRQDPSHLLDLAPWRTPYWTFDELLDFERGEGVRSAFYILDEQSLFTDRPPAEWLTMEGWQLYAGRYDIEDERIRGLLSKLLDGGWEVGLHGSYESVDDRERLAAEKDHLETVLGESVLGGRQHYLRLEEPETWEHYRDLGLQYDTTLGSPTEYGFTDGYEPFRPFGDEFVVFPLTAMEAALPDPSDSFEAAWAACKSLLSEAEANDAVMTVLWHPRYFSSDHPGFDRLYRRLVRTALDRGAWVGSPGDLYSDRVGTR
ncbi:polysaccharide deacetylase family protein [Haloarcula nitratireducens]|uniref:polysaccharide deacetylase family protein n=1 Tax=Haloarcula nitratireducens TaxID=2487749 RepID=UPI001F2155CA|nr:polysaccharide deacetylase family protein [Halomicroarcula nitratireducens]